MIKNSQLIRSNWFGACGKAFTMRNVGLDFTGDGWYHFNGNWILMIEGERDLIRYWVWVAVDPRSLIKQVATLPEQTSVAADGRPN